MGNVNPWSPSGPPGGLIASSEYGIAFKPQLPQRLIRKPEQMHLKSDHDFLFFAKQRPKPGSLQQMDTTGRDCSARTTKRNRKIPTASVFKKTHVVAPWRLNWNLIHFQWKVSKHTFYSCKYTQMQNQNRRGACDVEHGGGCLLSKQPLFSFFPCSLGSPSEDLKQGVNSTVDGRTGEGCFFALGLQSRIFCFLGVLEPIRTGKHSGQGSNMMKTERCCSSFCTTNGWHCCLPARRVCIPSAQSLHVVPISMWVPSRHHSFLP